MITDILRSRSHQLLTVQPVARTVPRVEGEPVALEATLFINMQGRVA